MSTAYPFDRRASVWAVLCLVATWPAAAWADLPAPGRWVVYYGSQADPAVLAGYDWIVLDSDSHPPLQPLIERGRRLFGYLSLCEVGDYRSYFAPLREQGMLLHTNLNWPGSHVIDIRDPRWAALLVEEIVPRIAQQGFAGLFLDTLDQAAHLERTDPVRYRGMRAAAVQLVRNLREHYPELHLVVNRGYDLVDDIADVIDAIVGESVYTTYDIPNKQYQRVADATYREQVRILNAAKQRRGSALHVLTLDYWDPADASALRNIYAEQRGNGFAPYVSTIDLNAIVTEPALQ